MHWVTSKRGRGDESGALSKQSFSRTATPILTVQYPETAESGMTTNREHFFPSSPVRALAVHLGYGLVEAGCWSKARPHFPFKAVRGGGESLVRWRENFVDSGCFLRPLSPLRAPAVHLGSGLFEAGCWSKARPQFPFKAVRGGGESLVRRRENFVDSGCFLLSFSPLRALDVHLGSGLVEAGCWSKARPRIPFKAVRGGGESLVRRRENFVDSGCFLLPLSPLRAHAVHLGSGLVEAGCWSQERPHFPFCFEGDDEVLTTSRLFSPSHPRGLE